MGRFLWGGEGFAGIVGDFGRPSGQTWTVTHIEDGPAHHVAPRFATKLTASLEEHEDPQLAANENARWVEQQKVLVGVHTAIAGIDSRTWQTVRFTLWDARPVSQPGAEYQVLHLSEPTGV
jgi:hypothetical protein